MGLAIEQQLARPQVQLIFINGKFESNALAYNPEVISRTETQLAEHTAPLSTGHLDQSNCVDCRPIVQMADGTNDHDTLFSDSIRQLPGGLGFFLTMALPAAEAGIVSDAWDLRQANDKVVKFTKRIGYKDAAHIDCKYVAGAEKSVANRPSPEAAHNFALAIGGPSVPSVETFATVDKAQQQLLEDRFYTGLPSSAFETDFEERDAHTLAQLSDDPHAFDSEHPKVLYMLPPGFGFLKNEYHKATGDVAYAATPDIFDELAYKFSGYNDEEERVKAAVWYGLINTAYLLGEEGMLVVSTGVA